MMERVNRCEAQMWSITAQAAKLGVSVVIDCGLTRAAHRAKWADLAAGAGLAVRLHHLDVAPEERWRRVEQRNAEKGATYRLHVSRAMFDFVETIWEPPSEAEMARLSGMSASG